MSKRALEESAGDEPATKRPRQGASIADWYTPYYDQGLDALDNMRKAIKEYDTLVDARDSFTSFDKLFPIFIRRNMEQIEMRDRLSVFVKLHMPALSKTEGDKSHLVSHLMNSLDTISPCPAGEFTAYLARRHKMQPDDRHLYEDHLVQTIIGLFELFRTTLIEVVHCFEVNLDDLCTPPKGHSVHLHT